MVKREVAYVGSFAIAGNLLGLAFTIVTARMLTLDQYALFASTLFLFGIVGLVTSSLQNLSAYDVASQHIEVNRSSILKDPRLIATLKFSIAISVVLGLALLFLAKQDIIRDEPAIRYLSVIFYLPAAALLGIALGRLQGRGEMIKVTGYSFLGTLIKLVALITAKLVPVSAASIAWSLAISTYISGFLSLSATRSVGAVKIWAQKGHTIQIAVIGTLFWLATGTDLLFLNFALSGEEAGRYGIIANICRLALIPTLYLSQKSFSKIVVANSNQESIGPLMTSVARTGATLVLISVAGMFAIGDLFFTLVRQQNSTGYGLIAAVYLLCILPLTVALPLLQKELASPNNRIIYLLAGILIIGSAVVVTIPNNTMELLLCLLLPNVLITGIMLRSRYSVNRIIKMIGPRA